MPDDVTLTAEGDLSLFDARYRWVLLFALRGLRDVEQIDLDDPEQLDAAYRFTSTFVQAYVRERRLATKLDAMRVSAIAASQSTRAVVLDMLMDWSRLRATVPDWRDFPTTGAGRERIERALRSRDPSLEPAEIERLAREKRKDFAKSFGLQARITEATVSPLGEVRVHIAFEQDIKLTSAALKALEINGVPLPGARLGDVRQITGDGVKVRAVISASAAPQTAGALRSLPMTITATTEEGVRIEAFKLA